MNNPKERACECLQIQPEPTRAARGHLGTTAKPPPSSWTLVSPGFSSACVYWTENTQWERQAWFHSQSNSKIMIYTPHYSHKTCGNKWSKSCFTMREMRQRLGQWLSHDLMGVQLSWKGRIQVAPPTWTDTDAFLLILILGEGNAVVPLWIKCAALIRFLPKIMPQHGVPFTIKDSLNISYVPASLFCGVAVTATAFYASFWVYFVSCILLIKIKCKRKKDGSWQVKKLHPTSVSLGWDPH